MTIGRSSQRLAVSCRFLAAFAWRTLPLGVLARNLMPMPLDKTGRNSAEFCRVRMSRTGEFTASFHWEGDKICEYCRPECGTPAARPKCNPRRSNALARPACKPAPTIPDNLRARRGFVPPVNEMPRQNRARPATSGRGFLIDACQRYTGCSSAFRSAMISVWMFPGTGRYLASSIVNVPWPWVIERRSVE